RNGRHVSTHPRLIRPRRRAAAALSRSTTDERAAAGLLFALLLALALFILVLSGLALFVLARCLFRADRERTDTRLRCLRLPRSLPRPAACGERVGVRGRLRCLSARRAPLTRHASRVDLSPDRKSTRLNSSHVSISYAVFCLKKKKQTQPSLQPAIPPA